MQALHHNLRASAATCLGVLLIGDPNADDGALELGSLLAEKPEELSQQSDMAKAIRGTPTTQLVPVASKSEGVEVPRVRVSSDHVKVAADETHDASPRLARIRGDDVATALDIRDVLDDQRPTIVLAVGF
jgi:hypothetical protein